ncbi:hypothetical protein F3J44_29025, partial [Pantoea sp. Tr-811]|uniref:hypothetical protein n=1 Tax=Pantoea sp. Tr-811 TaxID=2608361 RepID=UPI0019656E4F
LSLTDALPICGVLISRGRNNSFGHPHGQVMERYRRHGMQVHDTAVARAALDLTGAESHKP